MGQKVWLWFGLIASAFVQSLANTDPTQIILVLSDKHDEMVVTWTTWDKTDSSTVVYWIEGDIASNATATGKANTYLLIAYESPYIHVVRLKSLQPGTSYTYFCGDEAGGWSNNATFTTAPAGPPTPQKPLVIASVGDHGTSANSTMVMNGLLKYNSINNPYNFMFLAGDLSYADGFQDVWDDYGKMITPFSEQIPWMTALGNHEIFWLFVPYLYRYNMPQDFYYSFNYQNVHFISLNSEEVEFWHSSDQYKWLEKDLKSVNSTETPWIIAGWHTPWYSSNHAHNDSGDDMRVYFEDLLNKYNVDLVLSGHIHAYERTTPMYNFEPNPNGPVYIVNGCGGNREGLYGRWHPKPSWSAYREAHWGFGTIEIHNNTHMHWQFTRADTMEVDDSAWIVRNM